MAVFALGAADDLADPRHQHVHGANGAIVVVPVHVEGLDLLGVVGHHHGLLQVLLGDVALVLALEIRSPLDRKLEAAAALLQDRNGLRVRDPLEGRADHVFQGLEHGRVDAVVEEAEVLGTAVEDALEDLLQEDLDQRHLAVQIAEGHLRLDHPELGQVPTGVRVLRAEGGAEGVDVDEGQGGDLRLELARHGEVGLATEEVPAPVHSPILSGRLEGIQGGDSEHLTRALGVRQGDHGGVQQQEAALLEEVVDGARCRVAHPHHRSDGVGAGTQVGDGAKELEAVALLLKGVVGICIPDQLHLFGADLEALALAR